MSLPFNRSTRRWCVTARLGNGGDRRGGRLSSHPLRLFTLMVVLATVAVPPAPAAAVTSLSFGPERQLSGNAVAQDRISVASNGSRYLAVWPEGATAGGPGQIRGALIEPDGTVAARIEILTNPYGTANPVVAWNGRSFFVVADYDVGGYNRELFGKMVSSDGIVSSQTVLVTRPGLPDYPVGNTRPALAGNAGTNSFYVAWEAAAPYIGYRSIFGAVVTRDAVVGPPTMLATPEWVADPPVSAAVASDGNDFFVAWDEAGRTPGCTCLKHQIYGTPVTVAGTPVVEGGAQITFSANGATRASMTSDGSQYLVAWTEADGAPRFVRATRLTPAGIASGTVDVAASGAWATTTAAAWDGKSFLVAWRDTRGGSYGGRVGADGSLIDPAGVAIGSGVSPALAGSPPLGKGAAAYVNSTPRLRVWTQ